MHILEVALILKKKKTSSIRFGINILCSFLSFVLSLLDNNQSKLIKIDQSKSLLFFCYVVYLNQNINQSKNIDVFIYSFVVVVVISCFCCFCVEI